MNLPMRCALSAALEAEGAGKEEEVAGEGEEEEAEGREEEEGERWGWAASPSCVAEWGKGASPVANENRQARRDK